MEEHVRDDRPDNDLEMSQPVAREGLPDSTHVDDDITETRVLARVPTLEDETDPTLGSRSDTDGRVIGQGVSTKMLLAVAVCFVLVATVFWLGDPGGSNSTGDGGTPPAPDAPEAPRYGGGPIASDPTPSDTPNSPTPMSTIPDLNIDTTIPELPAWANTSPTADSPIPEAVQAPVDAAAVDPPPAWNETQPASTDKAPADIPRVSERTSPWNERSAPPTMGSEPVSSSWPRTAPTASPTYDRSYREAPAEASVPHMARRSLTPEHVAAVPAEYRNRHVPESRVGSSTWAGRPAQPGVARLEGTIEKPSFRTTDDRARSSVH